MLVMVLTVELVLRVLGTGLQSLFLTDAMGSELRVPSVPHPSQVTLDL